MYQGLLENIGRSEKTNKIFQIFIILMIPNWLKIHSNYLELNKL